MSSVTVRNLSDDIVEGLKARARRHDRSMEAEIRSILREVVLNRQLLLDLIDRELTDQPVSTTAKEVDRWIRETRERPA